MKVLAHIRIIRYAVLTGFHDYAAAFTWRSWLGGWFLRVVAQVVFFALIGRLLGTQEAVRFLVIGNAVMLAAMASLLAVAGTTWERRAGTLPLLIASPASPPLVFAGRSLVFVGDGLLISLGALLVVAPLFDIALPWTRVPLVVPLVVVTAVSTYGLATFLGGLVLRAMSARNAVGNVAQTTIMAICGVNVPLAFYPAPVEWLAHALPLTHGLRAIRDLLAGEPLVQLLPNVGLELLVGAAWLALALLTFNRLAEGGRRDGSIEFAT